MIFCFFIILALRFYAGLTCVMPMKVREESVWI